MKIELLKDVTENGQVKTTLRPKRKVAIGWFQGTQMEVSDATGQKLIEAGTAKAVEDSVSVEE